MAEAKLYNQVWIDGVELTEVVSGDVSAMEEETRNAIAAGGGWVHFGFAGGDYKGQFRIWISPASSVILRYVDN